jgi:hypothetical protein
MLLIGSLGAACAAAGGPEPPPTSQARPTRSALPTIDAITAAVRADAARVTGREVGELVVESAEPVTWSDGSLGCPRPDMSYTQALVPGYRIRIRAGERVLDYHASQRGHFVLCPSGQSLDPLGGAAIR